MGDKNLDLKTILIILLTTVFLGFLVGFSIFKINELIVYKKQLKIQKELEIEREKEKAKEKTYTVSLFAVGDNLIHDCIYNSGRRNDGTYNFEIIFEKIKDEVNKYDIGVINQETILVSDSVNVSSYPRFGTPVFMADAIANAGFDVVLHASNHTFDKGLNGVKETLAYWNENFKNVKVLGIHDSIEDYENIDIVEKNGIKLAMFNYTYGTNGLVVPKEEYYRVDLLSNKEKFLSDVTKAESLADVTICFLHIGTEYVHEPTDYQKEYINELIECGADIIVCAHPHVIQPYGMIRTESGKEALVYYSCGNFMSHQDRAARMLGGAAVFEIKKITYEDEERNINETRSVEISSYDFIPLVTHCRGNVHTTYKLIDYTEELAKSHSLRNDPEFTLDNLWNLWTTVTGKEKEIAIEVINDETLLEENINENAEK